MKRIELRDVDFSKDQFVFFVYLCLVMADGEMKVSEINHVFDRLSDDLFEGHGKNGELVVTQVYTVYKKLDAAEKEKLMQFNFNKHFGKTGSAQAFLIQLHSLMESDGLINEKEEELYHKIMAMIQ